MADVSLIPKEAKQKFAFKAIFSKIGIFIIILLILSIGAYIALYYYNNSLNVQLEDLKGQVEEVNEQRDIEFEKKVLSLEGTILIFKNIFEDHTYWSNIFSKLEAAIIPQVALTDFNGIIAKDGSVDLSFDGQTTGYTYLAKQMVSFLNDPMVADLELSGLSLSNEGGIKFGLRVNLLKQVLTK